MGLYERLLGIDPVGPKIPIHSFQAICAQWATVAGIKARLGV